MLNIAVLAPMPTASTSTISVLTPGDLTRTRMA